MAASSNTTWLKGFSGNPAGAAYDELGEVDLVVKVGRELVLHPLGGEDAVPMTRWEALTRTLWTRAVIDGDMTALKLLFEFLPREDTRNETMGAISADDLAVAEALLRADQAELDVNERD